MALALRHALLSFLVPFIDACYECTIQNFPVIHVTAGTYSNTSNSDYDKHGQHTH